MKTTLFAALALFAMGVNVISQQDTEDADMERNRQLQANFGKFQAFDQGKTGADGQPVFQTITLNAKPVLIDGKPYDGFRFKVKRGGRTESEQRNQGLVWAWLPPVNSDMWYIVPKEGKMNGFENFSYYARERYTRCKDLEPAKATHVYVQTLNGQCLVEDEEYLIFFRFTDKEPARISVALGFAEPGEMSPAGFLQAVEAGGKE